ncbi:hypothetical protein [Sulfurimonas diazotrophicus]|uniref:Uncharacterized protein n=1 Tax=Sulfurimonas diazotrophicus TaxID=3131939 RepID=A0ABZ3HAZ3_9BACT
MLTFEEFRKSNKDCSNVSSIQDVNDQYDYKDTHGGGRGDSTKVSCGQDKTSGYNELKDKFNKYFYQYLEKFVARAMCKCCKETSGKSWQEFYDCMKNEGYNKA